MRADIKIKDDNINDIRIKLTFDNADEHNSFKLLRYMFTHFRIDIETAVYGGSFTTDYNYILTPVSIEKGTIL